MLFPREKMACRKSFTDLTRHGKVKRLRKLLNSSEQENSAMITSAASSGSNFSVESENSNHHLVISVPSECVSEEFFQEVHIPESQQGSENWSHISTSESEESDEYVNSLDSGSLASELRDWAVKFQVTTVALSALLCILKLHTCFSSLPSDSRSLLKTPSTIPVRPVNPGFYHHIGIGSSLQKMLESIPSLSEVKLMLNIDGLPLFKSSTGELWPILASVLNVPQLVAQVFPVGVYYGKKKPGSLGEFLSDFVQDMRNLIEDGLFVNGKKVLVYLSAICCDAPAKSFILGIKGHTGYSSCTRCTQEGTFYKNRMTFPAFNSTPRTNDGFLCKLDPDFHIGDTPLTLIPGLNFVLSFPLDYMHLVCLGVMRTILNIWICGPVPLKLSHSVISRISCNLLSLKHSLPSEFCRKPRSLDDIKRWKATEFRQFLLYTGPVVLKNVLLPDYEAFFNNFLSLNISFTILLSPKFCFLHRNYAKILLEHFVKSFKNIYGQQYLTHNFHGLLHVADDVLTYGPLDNCSAFKFENFLQYIKRLVRKGEKPLQQVIKRLAEVSQSKISDCYQKKQYPCYKVPHSSGPLLGDCDSSKQFKKVKFQSFELTTSAPNSCCSLNDGGIVIILNIVSSAAEDMIILCKQFKKCTNFYSNPFCNSSSLDIYEVSDLSEDVQRRRISEISQKIVLLPLNETLHHLALPLLHSV